MRIIRAIRWYLEINIMLQCDIYISNFHMIIVALAAMPDT
jgi:hypothetical protein